jgi:hypothetical protein
VITELPHGDLTTASPALRSLVDGLLEKKQQDRLGALGAEEIKQHPFFAVRIIQFEAHF